MTKFLPASLPDLAAARAETNEFGLSAGEAMQIGLDAMPCATGLSPEVLSDHFLRGWVDAHKGRRAVLGKCRAYDAGFDAAGAFRRADPPFAGRRILARHPGR